MSTKYTTKPPCSGKSCFNSMLYSHSSNGRPVTINQYNQGNIVVRKVRHTCATCGMTWTLTEKSNGSEKTDNRNSPV